jgi:hypothetical protein
MDPNKYAARAKFKSLPLDFQYQDAAGYESNWDYIKANFSNYHFDKWQFDNEGDWYDTLGRFEIAPNMEELLTGLEEESKKVGWHDLSVAGVHPGFPGGKSPLHSLEEHDREASGIEGEFTQIVPEPAMYQIKEIQDLATYWKLKRLRTRIHIQMPGQSFIQHIDKLWHRNPSDPTKVLRIMVALRDYEPGQLITYGNAVYTRWKAGDISTFDTLNVPHASVNLSRTPRPFLIITGIRTPETDELLLKSNKDTIHYPYDKS